MTVFNRDAEIFEQAHGAATKLVGDAAGNVVKIARFIHRDEPFGTGLTRFEQIELDLGMHKKPKSHFGGVVEGSAQHPARVGRCGLAVGGREVTEHARGGVNVAPWQHLEG